MNNTKEALTEMREEFLKELLEDVRRDLLKEFEREDKLAEEAKNFIRVGAGRPKKYTYSNLEERKKVYREVIQKRYNKKPHPIPDTLQKERKKEANKKYYEKVKTKKSEAKGDIRPDEIKNENDISKEILE